MWEDSLKEEALIWGLSSMATALYPCVLVETLSLHDQSRDQRMISHMISAIKSRDHYMIVM